MIPLVFALTLLFTGESAPVEGLATYYAPGIMQEVQANREAWGHVEPCPECVGAVALLERADVGRKVWVQHPAGETIGPLLVVDCAARQDAPALRERGWVVDLPYEIGRLRWGMRGPLAGVKVLFAPPIDDQADDHRSRE